MDVSCTKCGRIFEANKNIEHKATVFCVCGSKFSLLKQDTFPKQIQEFTLLKRIHRHRYHDVFLAYRILFQGKKQYVVIKKASQFKYQKNILKEASNVSLLTKNAHSPFLELRYNQHEPYLVFEYMQGITCMKFMKNARREYDILPKNILFYIAKQIVESLHYSHTQFHMIHGDLSPSDILIEHNGHTRIIDWESRTLHYKTHFDGKAEYTAPEIFQGEHKSKKSDIFSLGIILWELRFLRKCFSAKNQEEVIRLICSQEKQISSLSADFEIRAYESIVQKCLKLNPEERPSIEEIKQTFDCYVLDQDTETFFRNHSLLFNQEVEKPTHFAHATDFVGYQIFQKRASLLSKHKKAMAMALFVFVFCLTAFSQPLIASEARPANHVENKSIQHMVDTVSDKIQQCYRQADLFWKRPAEARVTLVIGQSGNIREMITDSSFRRSSKVFSCIRQVLTQLKFMPHRGEKTSIEAVVVLRGSSNAVAMNDKL